MLFYDIPEFIDKWTLDTLNKIVSIGSIEDNLFEIKGKDKIDGDVSKAICSFSNSNGGYLIIGIDEDIGTKNPKMRFKLNGFNNEIESEDDTLKKIASHIYKIEPPPEIIRSCIYDKNMYFIVLQIIVEEHKKPFFANNICYLRIDGTSRPATRSMVLALVNSHIISSDNREEHKKYITNILKKIKNLEIKKENHDKYYLEVPYDVQEYEDSRIRPFFGEEYENKTAFMQPLERLKHRDWAVSHLLYFEYEKIYEAYNSILSSVRDFNSIIENKKKECKNEFLNQSSNLNLDDIDYMLIEVRVEKPQILIKNETNLSRDELFEHIFEILLTYGSYTTIEYLKLYVKSKEKDSKEVLLQDSNKDKSMHVNGQLVTLTSIMAIINEFINTAVSILSDTLALKRTFGEGRVYLEKELDKLIDDLEAGDILKGYCKIGY